MLLILQRALQLSTDPKRPYLILSLLLHLSIVFILIIEFNWSGPLIVAENTNKQDIISAVLLGDTSQSKIITPQALPPPPIPVATTPTKMTTPAIDKNTLSLAPKKPPTLKKDFEKSLLADLEKFKKQQKKHSAKQLKDHFEKSLHQQIEHSRRQSSLEEDIKLSGSELREAQGLVNRYQALIQQAIGEHWIVPPGANKKAFSMLLIRLAHDGTVLDVQITQSSGNPALDASAKAAVFKASPLPVPRDATAFATFKQFLLKAKPENIQNTH